MKTIYTIGHSTRPLEEFLSLLQQNGIKLLADVRTIPKSLRNPQYHTDNLKKSVESSGIQYVHLSELGGLRKSKKGSVNTGWKNASFRGYADHMQTQEFKNGLRELKSSAQSQPTAIMCAEAVPWRCHRSLISDALKAENWKVLHIISEAEPREHQFTKSLKIRDGQIFYPKEGESGKLDLWPTNK